VITIRSATQQSEKFTCEDASGVGKHFGVSKIVDVALGTLLITIH
jgi:hypothetical protein